MRVLLVDDDDGFRETLALALKRRGCEVREASGKLGAVRVAADRGTDAVILDVRLGSGNGMGLLPELRRLLPHSRIVLLTGYGSIREALEAVKLGADDYLLKPASASQVLAALGGAGPTHSATEAPAPPSLARLEWEHIQRVLHECGGNISRAAEALGIDRRTLQRKLGKLPPAS
jgi:two-component system response regulator RegA